MNFIIGLIASTIVLVAVIRYIISDGSKVESPSAPTAANNNLREQFKSIVDNV